MAGLLDQGYWPDGLYTAPTDEALASDIVAAKGLGFNLLRKHAKVAARPLSTTPLPPGHTSPLPPSCHLLAARLPSSTTLHPLLLLAGRARPLVLPRRPTRHAGVARHALAPRAHMQVCSRW